MINDPTKMQEIAAEWSAIRVLCNDSHRQAMLSSGVYINETPPSELYNLPLVLAYAVLDEVLGALIAEGVFDCKTEMLGARMDASKAALKWLDYQLVFQGKES